MRWFFQSAAVGLLTLFGGQDLYAQSSSETVQADAEVGVEGQRAGDVVSDTRAQVRGDTGEGTVGEDQRWEARAGGYYPSDSDPWFVRDDLREELELDDDQIERLRNIYDGSRFQREASANGDERAAEAHRARQRELRGRFDDDFVEGARSIFRDEDQRNRFSQLDLQYRGYSAFDNPRLQRELNLNDTQRRQLRDLNNRWNSELESLRGTYASNRREAENRFNELRERSRTNFEGILNEQQRTAYDEMIGDRFEFGADAYLGASDDVRDGSRTPQQEVTGSGLGTPQNPGTQASGIGTTTNSAGGAGTDSGEGAGSDRSQSGAGSGTGPGR